MNKVKGARYQRLRNSYISEKYGLASRGKSPRTASIKPESPRRISSHSSPTITPSLSRSSSTSSHQDFNNGRSYWLKGAVATGAAVAAGTAFASSKYDRTNSSQSKKVHSSTSLVPYPSSPTSNPLTYSPQERFHTSSTSGMSTGAGGALLVATFAAATLARRRAAARRRG